MSNVVPLFKDRREAPSVHTREQVRDHLHSAHGNTVSAKMKVGDMHDLHDALHEMVSNHSHAG